MLIAWLFAVFPEIAPAVDVAPEFWDRPRSGAAVLAEPGIRQSVAALLADPGTVLRIHHGGGDESLLQAEELRAWLIALALDGTRIELVNDLIPRAPLRIEIRK